MMMVEDKLKVHCGTKSLVPSLRARQREVQLPDGKQGINDHERVLSVIQEMNVVG